MSFRKIGVPIFVILFIAVIGLTVWLGIWTENEQAKNSGGKNGGGSVPTGGSSQKPDGGNGDPSEEGFEEGSYRFAAVAADEERCSQIGTRILAKQGGSAVDAAIATMLCIGVLQSHSTGIGGGSFMNIYDRKLKKAVTYDFREQAPGASTVNMYKGNSSLSQIGGMAVGVPGEIKGYWTVHQKYGKIPWKDLFEPTIKLCKDGFKIGVALAKAIKMREAIIKGDAQLREILVDSKTGEVLKQGDKMYRPTLAQTLKVLADEGADAFYNGSLSQLIVDDIKERGGIITRKDLTDYHVNEKPPITFDINGMKFYSLRPPSSGVITGLILNILDGFDLKPEILVNNPVLLYHRIAEAFKFAYAKRTSLGDEDFVDIKDFVRNLTSEEFANEIRKKIKDDKTQHLEYYEPTFLDRMDSGTSHLAILAANGDAVSMTSTINTYFGSKVRGKRTGIIFNNEMDDFSTPNITNYWGIRPSPANFVQPGKRPLSSMSPSIFVDSNGDVRLVVGASGGTKIITSVALTAMRTLWFDNDIKEAIDARRIHHQLLPAYIQYENGFPDKIVQGLHKLKNHTMSNTYTLGSANVQGVLVRGDKILAYSDFRKGGRPDGY